ncbi:hypothetical protein [Aurantimonas sp. VKM B-3413]|uniref:hypothetical protein n=1 Tax=Aurantimonas sp. VKM B-3413 TaxID=2779401 RepID=UPI001E2EF4D4|nr:hypothetical protein [Aurantimonas sp. VKM B-3413]MCB8839532.1 hypothetical protein [Aurantimonas sp. VKM B-3413]
MYRAFLLIAAASLLTAQAIPAVAQSNDDQKSYQVSELRPSIIPVPSERPVATAHADTATQKPIRRTDSGIRIVGPVFFPDH